MKIKISVKILLLLLSLAMLIINCSQEKTEKQLFSEADSTLARGDVKSALRAYKGIIKLYPQTPSSPKALFMIGVIYLDQFNEDEKAKETFQKILNDYPDYDLEKDFFDYAQESQNSGKPKLAIKLYQEAIESFPDSPNKYKALFLIGFVYSEQLQDYDKGREAYKKVVDLYPDCDLADDAEFMLRAMGSDSLPEVLK